MGRMQKELPSAKPLDKVPTLREDPPTPRVTAVCQSLSLLCFKTIARRLPRRFLEMLIASVGEMFLQIFS